jgi:coenzyme Q-binding protein COQ10
MRKEGSIMARVERSITINAPVEKVFAYIEDPINELEWIPSLVEIQDVAGQGVETHFRWAYKMAGMRLEGEGTNTEYIPNERIVTRSKGGIVSTWALTFEPHDGGTKLNLVIEYTIPVPVLGKLAEALVLRQNEREADLALANIKDRMGG